MKSGLEGRNNDGFSVIMTAQISVSMKSGLEGRNNYAQLLNEYFESFVSQ